MRMGISSILVLTYPGVRLPFPRGSNRPPSAASARRLGLGLGRELGASAYACLVYRHRITARGMTGEDRRPAPINHTPQPSLNPAPTWVVSLVGGSSS